MNSLLVLVLFPLLMAAALLLAEDARTQSLVILRLNAPRWVRTAWHKSDI